MGNIRSRKLDYRRIIEEGKEKRLAEPKGYPTVDNQGRSETCVRFSVAKAVANDLFRKKIDVEQGHIMIALVQELKHLGCVNPMKLNQTKLYLQDKDNERGVPNKCWWKVNIQLRRNLLPNSNQYKSNSYILNIHLPITGHHTCG